MSDQPFTFSLNHATFPRLAVEDLLRLAERHGLRHVALWRDTVVQLGVARVRSLLMENGFQLTSLCRAGWFTAADGREWRRRIDDNRRAIEDAAMLTADVLPLVCGPAADGNLAQARAAVVTGIAEIATHAEQCGVKLGIEPLHPMFTSDRSVVVTIAQAHTIAEEADSANVGVVVDAFNTWWDPALYKEIMQLGDRLFGVQVADWLGVSDDRALTDRGFPGDGVIDLASFLRSVQRTRFSGAIEIEVLSSQAAHAGYDEADAALKRTLEALWSAGERASGPDR